LGSLRPHTGSILLPVGCLASDGYYPAIGSYYKPTCILVCVTAKAAL